MHRWWIEASELVDAGEGCRPTLAVTLRQRAGARGRCGRSGAVAPWLDNGGGARRWRHVDVGFATSEIVSAAFSASSTATQKVLLAHETLLGES